MGDPSIGLRVGPRDTHPAISPELLATASPRTLVGTCAGELGRSSLSISRAPGSYHGQPSAELLGGRAVAYRLGQEGQRARMRAAKSSEPPDSARGILARAHRFTPLIASVEGFPGTKPSGPGAPPTPNPSGQGHCPCFLSPSFAGVSLRPVVPPAYPSRPQDISPGRCPLGDIRWISPFLPVFSLGKS